MSDIVVRLLGPDDASVLGNVAEDVFDNEVDPRLTSEFLADSRHHLAVALAGGQVVGFASAVHYVHPDKRPEMFINEVGVALAFRRRGIGRRLLAQLFDRAEALGCGQAWIGTEPQNVAARGLYAAAGGTEEPEPFVVVAFTFRKKA